MKSYSPYDNLEAKAYPTILVKSSYNDSQVMYWEPAKYVARLRAVKTDANPLRLPHQHGSGGPRRQERPLRPPARDGFRLRVPALAARSGEGAVGGPLKSPPSGSPLAEALNSLRAERQRGSAASSAGRDPSGQRGRLRGGLAARAGAHDPLPSRFWKDRRARIPCGSGVRAGRAPVAWGAGLLPAREQPSAPPGRSPPEPPAPPARPRLRSGRRPPALCRERRLGLGERRSGSRGTGPHGCRDRPGCRPALGQPGGGSPLPDRPGRSPLPRFRPRRRERRPALPAPGDPAGRRPGDRRAPAGGDRHRQGAGRPRPP